MSDELMQYPLPGGPEGQLPPAPVGDTTGMDASECTCYRLLHMGHVVAGVQAMAAEWLPNGSRSGPSH
ncbi:hypothetical protein ABZ379_45740 [Streptomyces canus]|uniref:hypothetical protein n=1 Tax=Streptomyces canus TaxID=58343 RepID=UPI0033F65C33